MQYSFSYLCFSLYDKLPAQIILKILRFNLKLQKTYLYA